MTFTQQLYIDVIEKYKKKYYQIPTIREIAILVGVSSPGTVYPMLKVLKEKGYNYKEMKDYD